MVKDSEDKRTWRSVASCLLEERCHIWDMAKVSGVGILRAEPCKWPDLPQREGTNLSFRGMHNLRPRHTPTLFMIPPSRRWQCRGETLAGPQIRSSHPPDYSAADELWRALAQVTDVLPSRVRLRVPTTCVFPALLVTDFPIVLFPGS